MEGKTNWVAIVAAAIASMLIGFLWYGLLFQNQWMAGNGITVDGEKLFKNGTEMPASAAPMILNTVGMFAYALIMNWILNLTKATNWMDGLKVGGAIGLISAIGIFLSHQFSMSPASLTMVDGSYAFVQFSVIGAIIGHWKKR